MAFGLGIGGVLEAQSSHWQIDRTENMLTVSVMESKILVLVPIGELPGRREDQPLDHHNPRDASWRPCICLGPDGNVVR